MKNLNKFNKDKSGYIFFVFYIFIIKIKRLITTYWLRFYLRLKRVKLSKGCIFFGNSIFVRYPLSKITIGSYCSFRSDHYSNLIGVNRRCIISTHSNYAEIVIGKRCGFSGVTIGAKERIVIGDDVLVGANVLITDFDWHNVDPTQRNLSCTLAKPIIINNNVFIGVNTVIWKGVSIGKNSVIGAGSIVTKDIPENVIAAGNPAIVVKSL